MGVMAYGVSGGVTCQQDPPSTTDPTDAILVLLQHDFIMPKFLFYPMESNF